MAKFSIIFDKQYRDGQGVPPMEDYEVVIECENIQRAAEIAKLFWRKEIECNEYIFEAKSITLAEDNKNADLYCAGKDDNAVKVMIEEFNSY